MQNYRISHDAPPSVPNRPGARQGPEDGLPRPLDRTGRRKMSRPRPQNLKTAVIT